MCAAIRSTTTSSKIIASTQTHSNCGRARPAGRPDSRMMKRWGPPATGWSVGQRDGWTASLSSKRNPLFCPVIRADICALLQKGRATFENNMSAPPIDRLVKNGPHSRNNRANVGSLVDGGMVLVSHVTHGL